MSVKDGRYEEQKFRMKGPLSRLWPTLPCRRFSRSRRLLNRRMFFIFKASCFPESLDEGDFKEDMQEGLDVLVYSKVKKGRPWCGRIIQIVDSHKFIIHWFHSSSSFTGFIQVPHSLVSFKFIIYWFHSRSLCRHCPDHSNAVPHPQGPD